MPFLSGDNGKLNRYYRIFLLSLFLLYFHKITFNVIRMYFLLKLLLLLLYYLSFSLHIRHEIIINVILHFNNLWMLS